MKRPLLVLCLLSAPVAQAQYGMRRTAPVYVEPSQPDIPLPDPDPAFPLRVHLFNARWGGVATINHGYGELNLLDPTRVQGFNFAFECQAPFSPNTAPADTYQARWKKEPYQLEILTMDVPGRHVHTCDLHLAAEARPFTAENHARYEHGVSSALRVPWTDPDFAYETPDPDYPLQFHVIDGYRREDVHGDHGYGPANLADPATRTLQGADYTYDCGHGFITSSQIDNYFEARWVKPNQTLQLLLQRPGSDKVDQCMVTVNLRDAYPEPRLKPPAATPTSTP